MRFSYQVGMSDADHYLPLAKAAEAAGYDGITIPDSICYPQECSSKYPYNKDCLLYTSPSPRDRTRSRMPSSA